MRITYRLFDLADPIKQIMPSVNKIMLDDIKIRRVTTGKFARSFVVDYIGSQAGAGGLITWKNLPIPNLGGVFFPYIKLRFKAFITTWSRANLMRFENDVKLWLVGAPAGGGTEIQNINNGSSQLKPIFDANGAVTGWEFDIDKAGGGWEPSGLQTGELPLDKLFRHETEMYVAPDGKFSMTAWRIGKKRQSVPVALQGNPEQNSNWGPRPGAVVQLQVENVDAGTTQIVYQEPEMICSDIPF